MPLEVGRDAGGSCRGNPFWLLDARPDLCPGATIRRHHWRCAMNILPELQPALTDLTERFGARIEAVRPARPNEIYFDAGMELVPGFCAQLYKKWNGRLVSLFADDARAPDGVFHLYYVFALDAAHGFFILRVPVRPEQP